MSSGPWSRGVLVWLVASSCVTVVHKDAPDGGADTDPDSVDTDLRDTDVVDTSGADSKDLDTANTADTADTDAVETDEADTEVDTDEADTDVDTDEADTDVDTDETDTDPVVDTWPGPVDTDGLNCDSGLWLDSGDLWACCELWYRECVASQDTGCTWICNG